MSRPAIKFYPFSGIAKGETTLGEYNSYVSLEEADDYLNGHPYSDTWFCLSEDERRRFLIGAVYLIDQEIIPHRKTNVDQNLQFPRRGMIDPDKSNDLNYNTNASYGGLYGYFDSDTIPKFIKKAQIEEALNLIDNDRFAGPDAEHVGSGSIGEMSVSVSMRSSETLSTFVQDILAHVFSRNRGYGPGG